MNLNDYFDPVSLEPPDFSHLNPQDTISRSIRIHTPDSPIRDISSYDLAIFGIQEDRNARIPGTGKAANPVREQLYLLANGHKKLKIIDFGNLKTTATVEDTYFALRDILEELIDKSVRAIAIGGSQDMLLGFMKHYEEYTGFCHLSILDSKLDFGSPGKTGSDNFLDILINNDKYKNLIISSIGYQQYFTSNSQVDKMENQGHSLMRLGRVRESFEAAESYLRDSVIASVDLGVVKFTDAPGSVAPSPNGLFGHELCRLTRYAGASNRLQLIHFSEFLPQNDTNSLSSQLYAQAIWYFIEGHTIRTHENPQEKGAKKFIVSSNASDQNMIFYKSHRTERWWMELPFKNPKTGKNHLVSCSYEDYQKACVNEIPDKWWKMMRKFA